MTQQVGTTDEQLAFSANGEQEPGSILPDHASSTYYQRWLLKQKSLIPSLNSALILLPIDNDLIPTADYQNQAKSYQALNQLVLTNLNVTQPQVAALDYPEQDAQAFGIIYPVFDSDQQRLAVVALALEVSSQSELTQALASIEFSCAGLEVVEYQQRLKQLHISQQANADKIDVLARVLSEQTYGAAAMRLVTELAVLLNCDRVSFGAYKKHRCQLQHLSHSAQFGKKMNHVRLIETAMDECLDQGQIICFPYRDATQCYIERAHKELSIQFGDIAVVSIPLFLDSRLYGCLVLEGKPERVISFSEAEVCQSLASLVLPTIEEKRLNDRWWLQKTSDSFIEQLKRLFGPNYLGRKLVMLSIVTAVYLASTVTSHYRLAAKAQIESGVQRALVTPYDGYIGEALVRAGDIVAESQLLLTMDDKDLRLEKLKWLSEQSKLNKQYQEAIAIRDRAKINIINAQQEQVDAQLELVNSQIARGSIVAPFAGVVVSGDLNQRLGSAVSKGELLFEVAPLNSFRIRLQIPENRIADLNIGQLGTLHLSALPEYGFDFEVTKVTPIVEAKEGETYFIAEAQLLMKGEETQAQLRPGMEGVAKISIDERLTISIWTRELVDWLRIQYWSWWG